MTGVIARAAALGTAAGARSTLGLAGPVVAARGGWTAVAAGGMVAGELVADKLPAAPSRLAPGPLAGRVVSGAVGASVIARRRGGSVPVAALVGAAGALGGACAGSAWRRAAADRGWTWQGALVEDGVAIALTVAACR
jgi:uncharacterized membrane protein